MGVKKEEVEMAKRGPKKKQRTPEQERQAMAASIVMTTLMCAHRNPSCSTHNRWVWLNQAIKPKLAQGQTVKELMAQIEDAKGENGGCVDGLPHWKVFPQLPITEIRARRRRRITEQLEDEHYGLKAHTAKLYPRDPEAGARRPTKLELVIRNLEKHVAKMPRVAQAISDLRGLAEQYQEGQVADLQVRATELVTKYKMKPGMVGWIVQAIEGERKGVEN